MKVAYEQKSFCATAIVIILAGRSIGLGVNFGSVGFNRGGSASN